MATEREMLSQVMERHLDQLLEESEGQLSVAELEQTLLRQQSPLMRELFQTLIDLRQKQDFSPSEQTD
ncbi:hypothetical protein [Deinococcus marmoris]|uniref:hypothetical protein n=3 Tax=Deinococcus marmoris TaxID=249408 RepID=UPI000AA518F7|nr:hypothetical protein [Deinococcus marmoris]